MAENNKKTYEFYLPPPTTTKWEAFKLFLYNGERGEVLGRNGSSWALIGIFYVILYACLAGFFAAMLAIFYETLPADRPRWTQADSLIGTDPGMGFRPLPDESTSGSTLIWFRNGETGTYQKWVEKLDNYLQPYGAVNCSSATCTPFGQECSSHNTYGFKEGKPCIAVKLNRIFGWVPDVYKANDTLPTGLNVKVDNNAPMVYLTCAGENPADRENIGQVEYHNQQGFPASYFPYEKTEGYLSPIVMVQFKNPSPGILINVECRAWAKNIHYAKQERRGSVHFELLVDIEQK